MNAQAAAQLEIAINAYKTLAKLPTVVGAHINKKGNKITSKWSVRNLDKGKMTKYLYNYTLDEKLNVIPEPDFGIDSSNELLSAYSPNEKFKAVIREEKEGKDVKKQYLEVWQGNLLSHCIDLQALDIHGDVYTDSEFGCLDWSPDEGRVLYVAERKPPKCEPYIKRKPCKETEKSCNENGEPTATVVKGEEYIYRQDWGEQLVGLHLSVVVVCTLKDESFTILEGLPPSACPGQVRFAPDGQSVVGVAWETEPRRLGLIFCTNRPGYIFNLDFKGECKRISGEGLAVRSPRFSGAGDRLVWLQRTSGGPHHACHQLVSVPWPLADKIDVTVLIDIVKTHTVTTNDRWFYGIYCQGLPQHCFTNDGKRIVFSTPQATEICTYIFDIDSGNITDISSRVIPGSTSVLAINNDVMVAACSNLRTPTQLIVRRVDSAEGWIPVSAEVEVPSTKSTVIRYVNVSSNTGDDVDTFEVIYMAPVNNEQKKLPLIVWPHGGPHSNFVNAYSLEAALFRTMGFACLQVNYRGSTGQGQASVDYLLGRVGTADVIDCKRATEDAINRYDIDTNNIFLVGGSHGGFLVTHLAGQYPDTYAAVVSRNPVVDVASMSNGTDIPDWCAVEAGYPFTETGALSEQQLVDMRRCSPLVRAHLVRTPTALMLGSEDKRVPHHQGLEFYRRLKANGCETRLYMYKDNHSLSSTLHEMDHIINSVRWFLEHMH